MVKKHFILVVGALIVILSVWAGYSKDKNNMADGEPAEVQPEKTADAEPAVQPAEEKVIQEQKADFLPPLYRVSERTTKKKFGTFITPQNSPVQPEKFSGYHTGTDFEILPGEENAEVAIEAVCPGQLLSKRAATGYGGVAVESCELNGEPITVVYGHLKLASINFNVGDKINAGDTLGILGRGYSAETSGERKHLHLGFHKGIAINILGYVQNKAELSGWLDTCPYACGN